MRSYYRSAAPGMLDGSNMRLIAGLNEYNSPASIDDDFLSDMADAYPYRSEGLELFADSSFTDLLSDAAIAMGTVRTVIPSYDPDDASAYVFYAMTAIGATGWRILKIYHSDTTSDITYYDMTMGSVPAVASAYDCSSTAFTTEAAIFHCFTSAHENRLHFLKQDLIGSADDEYSYVDLPFYPNKIVGHANRIFACDISNKIWWCRAGDLYSWYSMEYTDNAIVTSANMKVGAYTIAAQPNTNRVVTITRTVTDTADEPGIVTIVGTNALGQAQTAVLVPLPGRVQSTQAFTTITSATGSGWVQGGATPDTITIGVGPVSGGYVQQDAGYWTIEKEQEIVDMCVLGNSIYVFAPHSIYVFMGYSYDTFALQEMVSDLGISKLFAPDGYRRLTVIRNTAYFMYNNEVYEFNGNNLPQLITRPVIQNGRLANGMPGGIRFEENYWVLSSDANSLYVYQKSVDPSYYYVFDYETRTWWKSSGLVRADLGYTTGYIGIKYIPSYSKEQMLTFASIYGHNESGDMIADYGFLFSTIKGVTQDYEYPHIVTKAFNTNPSEKGTLTDVLIAFSGIEDTYADIELLYSLSEDANDFQSVSILNGHLFTGDVQVVTIPLPVAYIANAHHYRIKISVKSLDAKPVRLLSIERRFRIIGRSR